MRPIQLLVAVVGITVHASIAPATPDPFAFLAPDIIISARDREQLDAGQTLVRVLPGRDGHLSLTAAVRTDVTADRFIAWMGDVAALQRGRYVPEIGVFSNPPRLDDLAALTIDDEDIEDIRRCRPGKCGVKLSDAEIAQLQAGASGAEWEQALQQRLREVVVRRAADYLALGDVAAPLYHDDRHPLDPAAVFGQLVERMTFLRLQFACLTAYTRHFPRLPDAHVVRSVMYWSKESLGAKPIISVNHLTIAQFQPAEGPEALAIAKQVYATHYKNGAVTATVLTGTPTARYLVYVHRSHVDVLEGLLGGVARRMIERRVKAEAPGVLTTLRVRLEAGDPPSSIGATRTR